MFLVLGFVVLGLIVLAISWGSLIHDGSDTVLHDREPSRSGSAPREAA